MMFVEAKWIYNYLLGKSETNEIDIFDICSNYKSLNRVTHYDKNDNLVESGITHILSSVRQELMQQICNQIKGLAKLKEKGHKVGKLKFKSDFKSLKFKQYGVTHEIRGNKLKIQGLKTLIPLLGLKQLKSYTNIDFTTMHMIKVVDDYYVCFTCYVDKTNYKPKYQYNRKKRKYVGIDLGIANNLTLSNGEIIDCYVEETERIKRLQRQIDRCANNSNNRYKLRLKLEKAYAKLTNKKNALADQIVYKLLSENEIIVIQDDNLNEMKDNNAGSDRANVIQHSILGRVKSRLKQYNNVIWLDRWFPTTQYCECCGCKNKLKLTDRIYVCKNCGHTEERDFHAANNMLYFYSEYKRINNIDTSQELAGVPSTIRFNSIKNELSPSVKESTTSLAYY